MLPQDACAGLWGCFDWQGQQVFIVQGVCRAPAHQGRHPAKQQASQHNGGAYRLLIAVGIGTRAKADQQQITLSCRCSILLALMSPKNVKPALDTILSAIRPGGHFVQSCFQAWRQVGSGLWGRKIEATSLFALPLIFSWSHSSVDCHDHMCTGCLLIWPIMHSSPVWPQGRPDPTFFCPTFTVSQELEWLLVACGSQGADVVGIVRA